MTNATIVRKINKTAGEMQDLIIKSKRKLFELEVMLSISDVKNGKAETFKSARHLFRKLK